MGRALSGEIEVLGVLVFHPLVSLVWYHGGGKIFKKEAKKC